MAGSLTQINSPPDFSFSAQALLLLCIFSAVGCSTVSDHNVVDTQVSNSQLVDDNVFCIISAGVWNCDSVTPKTPIKRTVNPPVATEQSGNSVTERVRKTIRKKHKRKFQKKTPRSATPKLLAVVQFPADSAVLSDQLQITLAAALEGIKGRGIEVHSYIDSSGTTPEEEWLAFDRAQVVKAYLETVSDLTISIQRADLTDSVVMKDGDPQISLYLAE